MGCASFVILGVPKYQDWGNGIPNTPELSENYPYQILICISGKYYLFLTKDPQVYYQEGSMNYLGSASKTAGVSYDLVNGEWASRTETTSYYFSGGGTMEQFITTASPWVIQSNHDIYNGFALVMECTTANKAGAKQYQRARNLRHKASEFVRNTATRWKNTDGWKRVNA